MSERPALTEPVLFKRIFQGLYGVLVLGFVTSIAVSGTYGAFFAPTPATESLPDEPGADCRDALTNLLVELEQNGQALMLVAHEATSESRWKAFSDRFRGRLQTIRGRCDLGSPQQAELADLANHLERHRLGYETALRSLTQIAGPSRARLVDALRGMPEDSASPATP